MESSVFNLNLFHFVLCSYHITFQRNPSDNIENCQCIQTMCTFQRASNKAHSAMWCPFDKIFKINRVHTTFLIYTTKNEIDGDGDTSNLLYFLTRTDNNALTKTRRDWLFRLVRTLRVFWTICHSYTTKTSATICVAFQSQITRYTFLPSIQFNKYVCSKHNL